jgi:hypothetical protein
MTPREIRASHIKGAPGGVPSRVLLAVIRSNAHSRMARRGRVGGCDTLAIGALVRSDSFWILSTEYARESQWASTPQDTGRQLWIFLGL